MRGETLSKISGVAAVQWGLFTARQAVQEQVSRWDLTRLASDGAIEQVGYGVYRIAGSPLPTFLDLKVAWLQLAPGVVAEDRAPEAGVLSHTSAAVVYGVGDFELDSFEFTRPTRFRTRRPDVIVHVQSITQPETRWIDQMLVTSPGRLVADLLTQRHDGEHVGRVFADMITARLIDHDTLAATSAPYAHLHGLPAGDGAGLSHHLIDLVHGQTQ